MKKYFKIFLLVMVLILLVCVVIFTPGGEILRGNINKLNFSKITAVKKDIKLSAVCTESDRGKIYEIKGLTVGTDQRTQMPVRKEDYCSQENGGSAEESGGWLAEQYCSKISNNAYVFTDWHRCLQEGCKKGECIEYSIYETTNHDQGIGWFNEEEVGSRIVAVEARNVVVLVPAGYEELAKAHVKDLIYCYSSLANFFGIPFSARDKILLKIFVGTDNANRGFSSNGVLFYKISQENIDIDLRLVLENSPDDFLYESGLNYCANTHELTHAFLDGIPYPRWAVEGFAEYTQKINQPGSKDGIECVENGFYYPDLWDTGESHTFFPYSDLSDVWGSRPGDGPKWYMSAMCLTQEWVEKYGRRKFLDVLQEMHRFQENFDLWPPNSGYDHIFVEHILVPVLGDSIHSILAKYGIQPEDYR